MNVGMLNTRGGGGGRRRTDLWSNVPKDLLTTISDLLDTRIDILRFRAVCKSWRSSTPPLPDRSPRFPIEVPDPKPGRSYRARLHEHTLYRLEPPPGPNPPPSESSFSTSTSPNNHKGWLVKVEEYEPGRFRLLNLLFNHDIRYAPEMLFRKQLNLLDYRVFELCKTYSLKYFDCEPGFLIKKEQLGLFVDKAIYNSDESAVLSVYDYGSLAFLRLGDKKWIQLADDPNYADIMLYKGKFHAINNFGQVVMIDYSPFLRLIKVWRRLHNNGCKKIFLQSSGDLYIIDHIISEDPDSDGNVWFDDNDYSDDDDPDDYTEYDDCAYFQIYKLNGAGWVVANSLEDQVAFLGKDFSFLASAEQLVGCKGNYIYFDHDDFTYDSKLKGLNGHNSCLFNLEDRSIRPLSTVPANFQVIWPPPT